MGKQRMFNQEKRIIMEEKNGRKAGKAIAILFGVLIAGLLVYAVVAISNKEKAALGETATEQYYDNHGLSFTYPSGYVISMDDFEDGMVDVMCEVKGSDAAQIEITSTSSEDLKSLSDFEKGVVCRTTLNNIKDELKENVIYRMSTFGLIEKGMLGNLPCYQMSINVATLLSGIAKMHINDEGQMLITVMLYENESYKNTLEEIEKTIKF